MPEELKALGWYLVISIVCNDAKIFDYSFGDLTRPQMEIEKKNGSKESM